MAPTIASYFKSGTRDNGERFVTLTDERPEWLQDAVRDAHRGTMPNDWIYDECRAAVEAFEDQTIEDEDDVHEYVDGRVDVYTKALYQWAADFCLTDTWSEAEVEAAEFGEIPETERLIAQIQYCVIRYIAEVMRNACVDAAENTETADAP